MNYYVLTISRIKIIENFINFKFEFHQDESRYTVCIKKHNFGTDFNKAIRVSCSGEFIRGDESDITLLLPSKTCNYFNARHKIV